MTTFEQPIPGMVVVALDGDVDLTSAATFRAEVRRAIGAGCATLVIDLRAVTFMDSQGLKALLEARSAAAAIRAHLVVVGAARQVRALLEVTGTAPLFDLR